VEAVRPRPISWPALNPAHLFGTTEIHSSNLKMFPKWRGTLELFERELKSCGPDQCKKKEWDAVIDGLRGKELMTQLREINTEMNDKRYITDPVNWICRTTGRRRSSSCARTAIARTTRSPSTWR